MSAEDGEVDVEEEREVAHGSATHVRSGAPDPPADLRARARVCVCERVCLCERACERACVV
jgi:hypothetical protein